MKRFTCDVCGDEYDAYALGHNSFQQSGCLTKSEAVTKLHASQLVCNSCEVDEEDSLDIHDGEAKARNEVEAWEFSGVQLDEGRLTAYWQSY